MNVKRFLQEKAKQDREALLTDSDEIFLEDLKSRVDESPKVRSKSHARIWVPSLIGVTTMILVIVSVLVFYLHPNKEIEYLDANLEQVKSNAEEVETSLHDFSFTIDLSAYSCAVDKVRDKISGDTIYFILSIESFDSLKKMELVFVTNEKYHYDAFLKTNEFISVENDSYSFEYYTYKTIDEEFGLEALNAKAELHKGKEYIYVHNYTELLLDPDGTFIETIQEMIN